LVPLPSRLDFATTHVVADIAVGDMNGDGFADIVTCGIAGDRGSVNVLLGNGDGTFQRPTQAAIGNAPAGSFSAISTSTAVWM
jgi:hypothetical protein